MTTAAPTTTPGTKPMQPRRNRALGRFLRNRGAVVGAVTVLLFLLVALFAPWLSPYDPLKTSFLTARNAPSAAHWFGTDELGRDVLTRVIYGARASLSAGMISVGIALLIGVPLGLLAGYYGGVIDAVISRMTEALLSVPFL